MAVVICLPIRHQASDLIPLPDICLVLHIYSPSTGMLMQENQVGGQGKERPGTIENAIERASAIEGADDVENLRNPKQVSFIPDIA